MRHDRNEYSYLGGSLTAILLDTVCCYALNPIKRQSFHFTNLAEYPHAPSLSFPRINCSTEDASPSAACRPEGALLGYT